MLVSVIVPVYNVEKYLRQCLDSILNQSYNNTEIIIVDDGSTDSSPIICDEYSKKHNNIKVIHKSNEGLGLARNDGMKIMTGDYCCFVDSDDYLADSFLENLINLIEQTKSDYVKSGFKRISDNGKIFFERTYEKKFFINDEMINDLYSRMVGSLPNVSDNIEMSVWASLYSTNIIKNNNIIFPSERELISEDLVFNMEYMRHSRKGVISDYNGYFYRYNPESLTLKYRNDRFEKIKVLYLYMKDKFDEYRFNKEVYLRLSKNFFNYLRMCLAQENLSVSKLNVKEMRNNLKKICNDDMVVNIINEYPVKKMGFKQRLFLYLIKKNKTSLLYILIKLKKI